MTENRSLSPPPYLEFEFSALFSEGCVFLVCSVVVLPCSVAGAGVGAGVVFGVWAVGAGVCVVGAGAVGAAAAALVISNPAPFITLLGGFRLMTVTWPFFSPSLRFTCLPLTSIQI